MHLRNNKQHRITVIGKKCGGEKKNRKDFTIFKDCDYFILT